LAHHPRHPARHPRPATAGPPHRRRSRPGRRHHRRHLRHRRRPHPRTILAGRGTPITAIAPAALASKLATSSARPEREEPVARIAYVAAARRFGAPSQPSWRQAFRSTPAAAAAASGTGTQRTSQSCESCPRHSARYSKRGATTTRCGDAASRTSCVTSRFAVTGRTFGMSRDDHARSDLCGEPSRIAARRTPVTSVREGRSAPIREADRGSARRQGVWRSRGGSGRFNNAAQYRCQRV